MSKSEKTLPAPSLNKINYQVKKLLDYISLNQTPVNPSGISWSKILRDHNHLERINSLLRHNDIKLPDRNDKQE